jgi:hypothetical protein
MPSLSRLSIPALIAVAVITRPSKQSLLRVLAAFARRRTGFFGAALARGALAFGQFAERLGSPAAMEVNDGGLCTLAQVDADLSRELFQDGRRYSFVGIFGHWVAIGIAHDRPPEVFYLGSALE